MALWGKKKRKVSRSHTSNWILDLLDGQKHNTKYILLVRMSQKDFVFVKRTFVSLLTISVHNHVTRHCREKLKINGAVWCGAGENKHEAVTLWRYVKYLQTHKATWLDDGWNSTEQNVSTLMPVSLDFKKHWTWTFVTAHTWMWLHTLTVSLWRQ